MSSTLAPIMAGSSRKFVPFGRVVDRSREDNRPDLESLSVFLGQGVVPRSSREDNHNRLGADLTKYLVVRPGDLVFNKLRTWQGGFGRSRHEGIVSPAYFVCRPSPGVDARYLHFVLLSSPYLAELTRLSKFMPPSQFDIMWDDLKHLPVPVPDLETQRSVADYLDTETSRIDALIEKKRRMVELLVERDIGLAHEVIVGAPIGGERVKSCLPWLGDLPNGWSLAPVASQFHVTLGRMLNAERAVRGDMRPYGKTSMCVGTR